MDAIATKSLTNTIRQILEAKIHDSFTSAADQLAMRGYVNRDERIALSGNIGEVLGSFGESIAQAVADKMVSSSDVDCIAAKEVSAVASPNNLSGPNSLLGVEGMGRAKKKRKMDAEKVCVKGVDASSTLSVAQDAKGNYRWLLRSSSGFRDRDGEVLTTKALADDCERMNAASAFGPLRWWHVGSKSATPERGLDIGDCDFSMMSGHTRIESGTFRDNKIGAAIATKAHTLGGSLGFKYPATQPDADKTITYVRTFERSLLPKTHASNLMALKSRLSSTAEDSMTEAEQVAKLKELVGADNHALVDSFLAGSKRDEAALESLGVGVKAKKDPDEAKEDPKEEAGETAAEEAKEDAAEADAPKKKMKEAGDVPYYDIEAVATAIMTKMAGAFITPAMLDERFAALTQTATKSADETKATLTDLSTRMKALEGDTPETKKGFKASEAGGVDIISGVLAQFASSQGLDVSKLGVKNSFTPKTDLERITERLTGEWQANGTAPIA